MPIRSSPGLKRSHGFAVLAFTALTLVVLITLGSLNNHGDHSRARLSGDKTTGVLRRLVRRAQDTASEQQLPPDATQLEPKTAKHPHRHLSRKEIIVKAVCSVVFVLLGGVFSGLSLGLMGLDSMNLQVLAASGPPKDRKDAQRVLSLLSHGRHFVLVCLLLSNVIVNETLPVFLDSLTGGGGLIAVLISSASIVIFGEILPQALCSQHGLRIGARCTGFVKALMIVEAPVCWPTAKLLDLLLGSHTTHYYRREELGALVDLHATSGAMSQVESELVGGVLRLQGQRVEECMRKDVYTVGDMIRVCDVDLKKLLASGQTYIPVLHTSLDYEKEVKDAEASYAGYIKATELVSALANPNELVRSLPLHSFVQVATTTPASESIAYLKQEDPSAVLLVVEQLSESTTRPVGFATLEDLARVIVMPNPAAETRVRSASLGATARSSFSRPPGSRASIGLGRFVQGIVDRHFTHRASSSQLSFRLSTSSDDDLPMSRPRPPYRAREDFRFPLLADASPIVGSGS
ncbi:hypothetical protein JCM8115_006683 [Rhodotorula mucilaginosa]